MCEFVCVGGGVSKSLLTFASVLKSGLFIEQMYS